MSTCNQEIKLRAKTQEEKEKSLPCLWSPLAVIPYGLEERQWDPWSAPSSPSVTSQVTWAINSVLWVSVSLYIGRDHWTRRSFRFLPELRFGAGGSLSDSGNLDSIIQPCTGCGVHWGGRGPGILYLGFILMEMKELDSKNKLSPLLDPMFCHVEFDGAPSANVPDGFLSWKFLEKYLLDGWVSSSQDLCMKWDLSPWMTRSQEEEFGILSLGYWASPLWMRGLSSPKRGGAKSLALGPLRWGDFPNALFPYSRLYCRG